MALPGAVIRLRTIVVIRESDARTFLLIEAWCGDADRPILLQVVDPSDHEE